MLLAARRFGVTTVVASLVAITATGCAAPVDLPSASTSPAAGREAGIRGTNLCIVNNSSLKVQVKWRGYPDARAIAPGSQNCNSGYETVNTADIAGTLEYEPPAYPGSWLTWEFAASNPSVEQPWISVVYAATNKFYGVCGGFAEGNSRTLQTDWLAGKIQRSGDSPGNKEFVMTLTDSLPNNNHADDVTSCHKGSVTREHI